MRYRKQPKKALSCRIPQEIYDYANMMADKRNMNLNQVLTELIRLGMEVDKELQDKIKTIYKQVAQNEVLSDK